MAGILRRADLKVEVHDEHLAQDAPDPEWLAFAARNNWIVITRDERIRYRGRGEAGDSPRESPCIRARGTG